MFDPNKAMDDAIDAIVATCDGDLRGAVKALLLVNEQLETELQLLHARESRAVVNDAPCLSEAA